jgi:hypothetical protein
LPIAIMAKRDAYLYCAFTAIVTLCVIVPEVAVIVRFDVDVEDVASMLAADCIGEEHPATPARVTKSRRAKNDSRTMIDLRLKPANASNPSGPINERLMPAREWNKLAPSCIILRS